ncbi:MAG: DNA polymerase III subunit delta [Phascolarctobacterium sp.]|nr:DNA polymerase III subunit delta [Phascolarctobacterium sp.]
MKLDAETLIRKLKQKEELPGVIAALGEESYFRGRIGSLLQENLFAGLEVSDREITVFERDTSLKEVEAVINNYPFFGGKSLVILKDEKFFGVMERGKKISEARQEKIKEQQAGILKILSDVPEYCTVFIDMAGTPDKRTKFYKDFEKLGIVCECDSIRIYNLAPWLDAMSEDLGGKLEFSAVGTIMEYLSFRDTAPLELLSRELEKLSVYAGERKVWTREDVQAVFAELPEVSQYALANAVADRRLSDALKLLKIEYMKSTMKDLTFILLCGSIAAQLRRLACMKELMSEGFKQQQIADIMKLHPFIIKKSWPQCRKFPEGLLEDAIIEISEMNAKKRSGGRAWPRLEEILVKLLTA